MSSDVINAARRLAEVLARENEALKRVDYASAVALAPEKEAALVALTAHSVPPDFPPALARRLEALTVENREQLERAIAVQTRVVQIVARAYAPPPAVQSYGARAGRKGPPPRTGALALSTRA